MGDNPSHFGGKPRHPVEQVAWDRVQEFLKTLNAKQSEGGFSYRLPTEQEWENAAARAPVEGCFLESGWLHPAPHALAPAPGGLPSRLFGDVWEWTASAYLPYPGFEPLPGAWADRSPLPEPRTRPRSSKTTKSRP